MAAWGRHVGVERWIIVFFYYFPMAEFWPKEDKVRATTTIYLQL